MKLWKTFSTQKREDIACYNTQSEFETEQFARHLNCLTCQEMEVKGKDGVMLLCIGTDRLTGDSLGPLVGHKLRGRCLKGVAVIGIPDKPVHAMNLGLYIRYIRLYYPDHVIVAIGAPAGSPDYVGYAALGRGALQSGPGVSKESETVRDIVIIGIVGGAGSRDPVVPQSVRPFIVMKMVGCICEGVCLAGRLWENAAIIWQKLHMESVMLVQIKDSGVILWESYMNLFPSC